MAVKKIINDRQRARKVYGFVQRIPDRVSLEVVTAESDAAVLKLDWKESVRFATTGSVTLPRNVGNVLQGIDGTANTLQDEDRILLKDQTNSSENGIYVVDAAGGTWSRSADGDPGVTLTCGATTYVESGRNNAGSKWIMTSINLAPGDPQNWVLFDRGNNWLVTGSLGVNTQMKTSDPVSIGGDYPSNIGNDIFFFVSGTIGGNKKSVFGGDMVVSGTLSVKTGLQVTGSILPGIDNTFSLGSENYRWSDVYTGDLHLRNDRGDWTLIEESEHLTVRNNKTGQLFKIEMNPVED
jgi:hypothetical protein